MESLMPQVSIDGLLPSYDSRLDNVIQPDGSYKVQSFRRSNIFTNLMVEQNIFWTGGTVFVNSNLNQFVNNQPFYQKQYQASLFAVGIRQPLTLFNSVRWNYDQIRLNMMQATKKQVEDLETLNVQIVGTYFDEYVAQRQLQNALQNVITNDTLYKISTGRYNVGKIAENELLQVELQLLNARNAVTQSRLNVEMSAKRLVNLLGIEAGASFGLQPVTDIPVLEVDLLTAIKQAKDNRSEPVVFNMHENEAKMQVRQSQSRKFASGEIFLSYGLNQTAPAITGTYQNPLNAQRVNISYSMPLVGWGKYKNEVAASRQNLEAVQAQLNFDKKNFEVDVENSVDQFLQLQAAIVIAAKSDTIAQKRFDVARNRYLLGKINITDLGLAQDAKDKAFIDYIKTLQQYWVAYYQLRRMTLYDFKLNTKIAY
jgi:outer membrane protein TolC